MSRSERDFSLLIDLLSTCPHVMEFRFDAMLCSNLVNEKSDTGHIKCSRGPRFPPLI